jgi:hypothetical protein
MTQNTEDASRRRMQEYDTDLEQRYLLDRLNQDNSTEGTESGPVAYDRAIERLFRSASLIDAPRGFTDRVMAAIAAGETAATVRRQRSRLLRLRWWLLTLLIVPLTMVLFTVGPAALALALLVRQAVWWLNDAAAGLATALGSLASYTSAPLFSVFTVGSLMLLVMMMAALTRVMGVSRQQVAYRVPVRFH